MITPPATIPVKNPPPLKPLLSERLPVTTRTTPPMKQSPAMMFLPSSSPKSQEGVGGLVTYTSANIDVPFLDAIFDVEGNDTRTIRNILQNVQDLPALSVSSSVSASAVGSVSPDDTQTAHSQDGEELLPHEETALQKFIHVATVAGIIRYKHLHGDDEYLKLMNVRQTQEDFMNEEYRVHRREMEDVFEVLLGIPSLTDVIYDRTDGQQQKKPFNQ